MKYLHNLCCVKQDRHTALMLASKEGYTATVQALIGVGADINLQNKVSVRWLLISLETARGECVSLFQRVCQCTRFVAPS
jgi:ankyrin repeat protein